MILFLNGSIMHNMLQLNGGVLAMPAHIKTRVSVVVPRSANLGYLICNDITYFAIIRIVNLVKPQALGHWYGIYFTFSFSRHSYKGGHVRLLILCPRLTIRVTQSLIVQICIMFQ
jgi:hypothetical protein